MGSVRTKYVRPLSSRRHHSDKIPTYFALTSQSKRWCNSRTFPLKLVNRAYYPANVAQCHETLQIVVVAVLCIPDSILFYKTRMDTRDLACGI